MDGIRIMKCDQCGRQWNAVCYASSERLECPCCGYMVQVQPAVIESDNLSPYQRNLEPYSDGECTHEKTFEHRGLLTCRQCACVYDEMTLSWVEPEELEQ